MHFDHVGFAYSDGTQVLNDFNLHMAPGETVAVVGRTGSGKTTAGRLLNRSYDVSAGQLLIDGRDVREYTLESLRAQVGFVFDEPFLFSVSIRDNIAYGKPGATMEEIVAAARAADADEFIVRLPDGYDTVVGERGYTLSGGQRQRMAIARTLLVNPPVLVLDDATSAIDVQVEQRIHASLLELMADRTTMIIAHRLATISLADRVVLVENGHVIASGRHQELLQNDPRYAEVLAHVVEEAPQERRPMSMAFGGGPMWGGVSGGGRPGAWGGAGNATQGGAPFAGIPPELQEPVTRLVETEPDHGEPEARFTQRATDTRPLTLKRMIMDRWRIALLSVFFLTIETVGFQTGPYLTQIGIDDGLVGRHRHLDVIVVCGLVYLVTVVLTVFVERAGCATRASSPLR